MSTLTSAEFQDLADETLEEVHDAVEQALESAYDGEFDVNLSQGVLNMTVPPHGTWVLNKQGPNKQIWWSSPISGPKRFEWEPASPDADAAAVEGDWVNTRDGVSMKALLAQELRGKLQLKLDLK